MNFVKSGKSVKFDIRRLGTLTVTVESGKSATVMIDGQALGNPQTGTRTYGPYMAGAKAEIIALDGDVLYSMGTIRGRVRPVLYSDGKLLSSEGVEVATAGTGAGAASASSRLPPDFEARAKRLVSEFRTGRSQFQALQQAISAAQPGECVVLDNTDPAILGGDGVWQLTGKAGVLVVSAYGTAIRRADTNPDPYANLYVNQPDMQFWGIKLDGVCALLDAGAHNAVFKNCIIEDIDHSSSSQGDVRYNGGHGIRIAGAKGVLIENNTFQNILDNSVIAYDCDRLTVRGNFTANTARLLHIPGGTSANYVNVVENTMRDVKRIGLELQQTGAHTLVARNIFWGYKGDVEPVDWGAFSLAVNGENLIVEDNIFYAWRNGVLSTTLPKGMEFSGLRAVARRNIFYGFSSGIWMTGDRDASVEDNVFYGTGGGCIVSAAPEQVNGIRRTLSVVRNRAINCGGPTVDIQFPFVYTSIEQRDNTTLKSVSGVAAGNYHAHKLGPVARETGVDGAGNTTYVLDGQGSTFSGNKLILTGTRDAESTATFALLRNEGTDGNVAGAIVEKNSIRFRGREPNGGGGFLSYASYARFVEHSAASFGSRWVWYRDNLIDGCVDYVVTNGNAGGYIATGNVAKNIPEASLYNIGGGWGTQPVFSNNGVFRAPNGWSMDSTVSYFGSTVILTPTGNNAAYIIRNDVPVRFDGFEQRVFFEQSSATTSSARVVVSTDGSDSSASRVDEFQLMETATTALFRATPNRTDKWAMVEYTKLPARAKKTGVTTAVPANGSSTVTVNTGDGLYAAANGARAAVSILGINLPAGITVSATTTAANTVTVTYTNSTGAVVNVPAHTVLVNVLR